MPDGYKAWICDDLNMAELFLEKPYKNFELNVDVTRGTSGWLRAIVGFGATEPGKHFQQAGGGSTVYMDGSSYYIDEKNKPVFRHGGWDETAGKYDEGKSGSGDYSSINLNPSFHLRILVQGKTATVYVGDLETPETFTLPDSYEGGYIYLASNSTGAKFSNLKVQELSFSNYYYSSNLPTFYLNDTMERSSFEADWAYNEKGMIARKNTETSWGTAAVYSTESYTEDYEMEFQYTAGSVEDKAPIYIGIGMNGMGGAWCDKAVETLPDPSPTILQIYNFGQVAYAPMQQKNTEEDIWDGWLPNEAGRLFDDAESQAAVHTAKIRVQDGTVHVYLDGYDQGFVTMTNYQGGYVCIAGCGNGVSFSEPVIRTLKTITTTSQLDTGVEGPGTTTGGDVYKEGDQVTVTTSTGDDVLEYEFLGWYENDILRSREGSYVFDVTADRALVAKYKAVGKGTITVVDPQNASGNQTYEKTFGTKMTITAASEDNFLYWKNDYNMIVSRNPSFTYTVLVIASHKLTACYKEDTEKTAVVVWQAGYGQEVQRGEYSSTDDIKEPELPPKMGYDVTGWKLNVKEIKQKIEVATQGVLITVTPNYVKKKNKFTITVTNGTLNKEDGFYAWEELVVATATVPEGSTFSHWEDETGNILGYNPIYKFYATQNYTIKAVFDKEEEELGTATIVQVLPDTNTKKLSFVAMLTVPDGCTIEFGGILATKDSAKASNLTRENADYVRGQASDKRILQYTWHKTNVNETDTWYVRAYLVYIDKSGVRQEILGQRVTATLSGGSE